jgi:hypothetical protein
MILDKNNYLIYAAQNYQNMHCVSLADFKSDVKTFITARTLLRVYHKTNRIKMRLLLNHIITCSNVFGPHATTRLFFYHCEMDLHPYLIAIFDFMNILGDDNPETDVVCIAPDTTIEDMLKEI